MKLLLDMNLSPEWAERQLSVFVKIILKAGRSAVDLALFAD